MEKKVLLISIISIILSVFIYTQFKSNNINYVAMGDSLAVGTGKYNVKTTSFNDFYVEQSNNINSYNNTYSIQHLTARDLYDLIIKNNKLKENEKSIQNIISNANIITLAIGIDEINNNQNINLYLYYIEKVVNELVKLNNNSIYLIGLYSSNEKIMDINKMLNIIAIKYNINFIDIEDIYEEKNIYEKSEILNLEGHKEIVKKIKNM